MTWAWIINSECLWKDDRKHGDLCRRKGTNVFIVFKTIEAVKCRVYFTQNLHHGKAMTK